MTSFYSQDELVKLGFASIGDNVQISRKASFYGINNISIGNNVRIDDFCVLSAGSNGIILGNYIHIAVYASLIGEGKIQLDGFNGISSKVSIYSSSDDFTGEAMFNSTIPDEYRKVNHADVIIKKHVLIGSGAVILPGLTLNEGTAVGALSLINKSTKAFSIYQGVPAKMAAKRSRNILEVESRFLNSILAQNKTEL